MASWKKVLHTSISGSDWTSGGTDLAIANGGTGASSASAARTALFGATDLAVADGGTGASAASSARSNLGVTATASDTAYNFRANNLSDIASASTSRTNLGATTLGANLFTATNNSSAAKFIKVSSSNVISLRTASEARSDLNVSNGADVTEDNDCQSPSDVNFTSALNTKLAGITASADVTDANTCARGAQLQTDDVVQFGRVNIVSAENSMLHLNSSDANSNIIMQDSNGSINLRQDGNDFSMTLGGTERLKLTSAGTLEISAGDVQTPTGVTFDVLTNGSTLAMRIATDQSTTFVGDVLVKSDMNITPTAGAADLTITGYDSQNANIFMLSDSGDDNGDKWKFSADTSHYFKFYHNTGSYVQNCSIKSNGNWDFAFGVASQSLGVGTASSGTPGEIRATSEITAYYTSDIALKKNIKPITNPLDKIMSIGGYNFDWKQKVIKDRGGEDGYFVRKNDVGIIAQEIEKIIPEIVATREDGHKAVKYEKIVPLLIESIKELTSKVKRLENANR